MNWLRIKKTTETTRFTALICCIFVLMCIPQAAQPATQDPIKTWEVVQLTFTASGLSGNPYLNIHPDKTPWLYVTFKTMNQGTSKVIKIAGFWDGGQTWKVRFAPPREGKWTWMSHSMDPSMDNKSGHFNCMACTNDEKQMVPTRHGFIYVNPQPPRKGRFFVYADGTPFLWIGDTWWNWTKKDISFESFKTLADDRASKGFTLGQLFFAGNGWTENSSLLDSTFSVPDMEAIRKVESFIRYANEKGITVWIHPWWMRKNMAEKISREQIKRWWIYCIHRLAAYNVIWVLAGEYNMFNYGGYDEDFINELGELVKHTDPYHRIVSMHNTPPGWGGGDDAPQWSTATLFHDQPWLDYNQSQTGHGRWRNMMVPVVVKDDYARKPPKPVVVTETWYEFTEESAPAWDIRYAAWSAILSGAAGHTYGGGHIWRAHLPESPVKDPRPWPLDMDFNTNTLNYPGANAIAFMGRLLKKIRWWEMEPHPELISGNPSTFCSVIPWTCYFIYLPWGGSVSVNLINMKGDIHYDWYDLTLSEKVKTGIAGSTTRYLFHPPEDYPGITVSKDWLLVITSGKVKNE